MICYRLHLFILAAILLSTAASAQQRVGRFDVFEASFQSSKPYTNPYVDVQAEATFTRPDGSAWRIPLFWDGGNTWKVRISPDAVGAWSYRISSSEAGLNGKVGELSCVSSDRPGGIRASAWWPSHFERQDGTPFWFMGDTAWAYFTDIPEKKHDRTAAEAYVKARAAQGFNVIHSMLLSEGGDGSLNGPPWRSIADEQINPAYFREAEDRIAFANLQGVTVGVAIAWGDKQKKELFPWRRLPNLDARKRYARYIAARLSAYDVYFLVSGEWHGEVRTRGNVSEQEVFNEFVEIGSEFARAMPHRRMIGIHPMGSQGSSREFTVAPWMSFADYQQNYEHLHGRILASRSLRGPAVNSEYGYFLRDQDGDGKPDKSNSYSADDMRFASWDIATAGGYLVTGFGTTYFGGRRDPGSFDLNAPKNKIWEQQMGYIKKLFTETEWWRLAPADDLISTNVPRGPDVRVPASAGTRGRELHPPAVTYWALSEPGRTYVAYVRGVTAPVRLDLGARSNKFRIRRYNPRTGEFTGATEAMVKEYYEFTPPDASDWVVLMQAVL